MEEIFTFSVPPRSKEVEVESTKASKEQMNVKRARTDDEDVSQAARTLSNDSVKAKLLNSLNPSCWTRHNKELSKERLDVHNQAREEPVKSDAGEQKKESPYGPWLLVSYDKGRRNN
ncbi:hypothetical protein ACOSQ4_031669 [Xanthoceras sorbifolium]